MRYLGRWGSLICGHKIVLIGERIRRLSNPWKLILAYKFERGEDIGEILYNDRNSAIY